MESPGDVSFACLTSDTGERRVIEESGDRRVEEGLRVGLSFDPSRVYPFDDETEARIRM